VSATDGMRGALLLDMCGTQPGSPLSSCSGPHVSFVGSCAQHIRAQHAVPPQWQEHMQAHVVQAPVNVDFEAVAAKPPRRSTYWLSM